MRETYNELKLILGSKIFKKGFIAVFILSIPFFFNYADICVAEARFVSDDEKIRTVATEFFRGDGRGRFPDKEKYKNVDDFLIRNPGCCRIGPEPGEYDEITLFRRYMGVISDIVVIEYPGYYVNSKKEKIYEDMKTQMSVSSCGKLNWDFLF